MVVPNHTPLLFGKRGAGHLIIVVGLLATWVSEWMRIAGCRTYSADDISTKTGYLLYSFKDRSGGYYGGEDFHSCSFAQLNSGDFCFLQSLQTRTKQDRNGISLSSARYCRSWRDRFGRSHCDKACCESTARIATNLNHDPRSPGLLKIWLTLSRSDSFSLRRSSE